MNVIECHQLSKYYYRKRALHNLSFTIKEHTITGPIGRNGAGKTTLLRILAGYYRPSSGKVTVFSEHPFNHLEVSQNLIFVDDQLTFPSALTLLDILHTAQSFYPNWDHTLATRLLDYFSLHPASHHHELSKGQRSTFNMIIGLAARCPLTIFDEPTTGMDAAIRKDFYRALLKEYLAHPRTIILSSHLLNELEGLLEDVLLIDQGQLRLHLSMEDLKQYAIGLIGSKEQIEELTAGQEILHRHDHGANSTYIVVRNDSRIRETAHRWNLEMIPVPLADLFVYLTKPSKGRIDDVFHGYEHMERDEETV